MTNESAAGFRELGLPESLLKVLDEIGYETPSPIQAQIIPYILQGKDVLGQAQTGTGKTAAFALPLLANIDLAASKTQILVLAPTRELAIQVAEAFHKYAQNLPGFHVLPIYGGQDYNIQLRGLKRGVHVVVGTPGRVMDHMRRGTLLLDQLKCLVLDEADEMLRMGFVDDVEWILEQTPKGRQVALFSATMPTVIRRIANQHLTDPQEITIKLRTTTAETIRQRFWPVNGNLKLDALTRILEAEPFDAMLVFVRTKTSTLEVAEKLEARGYSVAALNGDIQQKQRERTIEHLKNGKLDIVVATDVAARGLDVERISHVVNFDIPNDTEAYVHRIGRTGRAGRKGDAILFVTPREKRMLQSIERATGQRIEMMELPSTDVINDQRIAKFKQRITAALAVGGGERNLFEKILEQYQQEQDVPAIEIAAALAQLLQGESPLLLSHKAEKTRSSREDRPERFEREPRERSAPGYDRDRGPERKFEKRDERPDRRPERSDRPASGGDSRPDRNTVRYSSRSESRPEEGKERFRIEVGHQHNVKPGNIVGAIANEAGIDSEYIGRISIFDDHTLVDLPDDMPKDVFMQLKNVRVAGQKMEITRLSEERKPKKEFEERKPPRREASERPARDDGKGEFKPKAKPKHKARQEKDKGKPKFKSKDKDAGTKAEKGKLKLKIDPKPKARD